MMLSLDEWIAYIFDRPTEGPEWYWDHDNEDALSETVACVYLNILFSESEQRLAAYNDAQQAQGFIYILGAGDHTHALVEADWDVREPAIHSIETVFATLFESRCTPALSHGLKETPPEMNPLNNPCYMWWDMFPTWGGHYGDQTDRALLNVMKRCLALSNPAVQESALHGLGHWHLQYPKRTETIIDEYLNRNVDLEPELKSYALAARTGCVL